MGFWDRLLGSEPAASAAAPRYRPDEDELAIERYRYLLRTAPPDRIEAVHAEAFARLTPDQRAQLLQQVKAVLPAGEVPDGDAPEALARAATRAEALQPGAMERSLGAPGFGSMFGSSLLGSVAGYVIASSLMHAFLPPIEAGDPSGSDAGGVDDDYGDAGGFFDAGSSDFGGFNI